MTNNLKSRLKVLERLKLTGCYTVTQAQIDEVAAIIEEKRAETITAEYLKKAEALWKDLEEQAYKRYGGSRQNAKKIRA